MAHVEQDHLRGFVRSELTAVCEQIYARVWELGRKGAREGETEGISQGPTTDIELLIIIFRLQNVHESSLSM